MARGRHREQLLEVGSKLLRERGFHATGVQEIASAAGIPKGSFYNYFPSKEAFALAVLERYADNVANEVRRALEAEGGSPLGRIRALFEAQRARIARSGLSEGCLAGRLAQELAGENAEFRAPLERTFREMSAHLAAVLREAQAVGEIDPALDTAQIASFLVTSWQGALLRAKSTGCDDPLREFAELALGPLLRPSPVTA